MRRIGKALLALVFVTLVAGSLSWTAATAITITDQQGAPASDAYLRYHYEGNLLNFVHPITYIARDSVVARADAEGRVQVPFRMHIRSPLPFSTPPHLEIDSVYVPRLHNAFGPVTEWGSAQPQVFTVDWERKRVTASDVSHDPESWERSLRNLQQSIRSTLSGPTAPAAKNDARTAAHVRELITHLRREFGALVQAHGRTRRSRPAPPLRWRSDDERMEWEKRVDEHLAREPYWGPYLARMWRDELRALERLEASLE